MSYILSTPTLQDILHDKFNGPYNRHNFTEFLKSIHCVENYEFVIEVNHYNSLHSSKDRQSKWRHIIKWFLLDESPKEINLPHAIKKNLNSSSHPNPDVLKKAYVIIMELLSDSYSTFVNVIRKRQQQRRNSSTQPPEVSRKSSGRRNSAAEYPKSPINNNTNPLRHNSFSGQKNINRIPSPQSDFENFNNGHSSSAGSKSRTNSSSSRNSNNSIVDWKKMKFKFRRNSNE